MCISASFLSVLILVIPIVALCKEEGTGSQSVLLTNVFSTILIFIGYFLAGEVASVFAFLSVLAELWHLVETLPHQTTLAGKHTPAGVKAACSIAISFFLAVKGELAPSILLFVGGALVLTILILKDLYPDIVERFDEDISGAFDKGEAIVERTVSTVEKDLFGKPSSQQQQLPVPLLLQQTQVQQPTPSRKQVQPPQQQQQVQQPQKQQQSSLAIAPRA